jgi:hypothetical protein
LGNGNVLSKCAVAAVVAAGDAEHLPVVAEVDITLAAEEAFTAGDGGIERDAIADVKRMNIRSDLGHDTSGLMTHNERRNAASGSAVIAMNIASADTAGFNLDEHILGADYGLRDVSHLKVASVFKHKSLHG